MSLKQNLLDLAETYEQIKNEAFVVVNQVKSKTKDSTDTQRLKYLTDKKDFNIKSNYVAVVDLAERNNVNITALKRMNKKYLELEKAIQADSVKLGELGLKNITIGPKALGAFWKEGCTVYLHINIPKKSIDVKVYPADQESGWSQQFEMSAYKLKKDIDRILE